jgi:hypothetical protein
MTLDELSFVQKEGHWPVAIIRPDADDEIRVIRYAITFSVVGCRNGLIADDLCWWHLDELSAQCVLNHLLTSEGNTP